MRELDRRRGRATHEGLDVLANDPAVKGIAVSTSAGCESAGTKEKTHSASFSLLFESDPNLPSSAARSYMACPAAAERRAMSRSAREEEREGAAR